MKKIGDIEVYEGMKARFTACASGYPEPDVEWFLNGDRIYPNDRTQIESEPNGNCFLIEKSFGVGSHVYEYILGLLRLTIHNSTQADVGKYTCRIYNPHGEDVCYAELVYDSKFPLKCS